jgi:hypothetical protein
MKRGKFKTVGIIGTRTVVHVEAIYQASLRTNGRVAYEAGRHVALEGFTMPVGQISDRYSRGLTQGLPAAEQGA